MMREEMFACLEPQDGKGASLPIRKAGTVIGRDDLPGPRDMQVSRRHLSFSMGDVGLVLKVESENPAEIVQPGTPPIRVRVHRGETAALQEGALVEILPGKHGYWLRYQKESASTDSKTKREAPERAVSDESRGGSSKRQKTGEGESSDGQTDVLSQDMRRIAQLEEDEALARALQEEENKLSQHASTSSRATSHKEAGPSTQRPSYGPFSFNLLRTKHLPDWANMNGITIRDVIQGDIKWALLTDYMVDFEWLLTACPKLLEIPHVVVMHGEHGEAEEALVAQKPPNFSLYKPPLPISYGTHHSKSMFLFCEHGIRVAIHTANLLYIDFNNKTQGLWMQDFPLKCSESPPSSPFEDELVEYMSALKWRGAVIDRPGGGTELIGVSHFRKYDYSGAAVRLVASVPGYHSGASLTKWGHMKLRRLLQEEIFSEKFKQAPLVYQFSSLGSLDEKWLSEFLESTAAGKSSGGKALGGGEVRFVWPTVEDVRKSLEGYAGGGSVPGPLTNVEKPFMRHYWARWQADVSGRARAMPHIKTFLRHQGSNLAYVVLTSHNLSKAAFGALQRNGKQLMVRSYELGVLFLPSVVKRALERAPFCLTPELRHERPQLSPNEDVSFVAMYDDTASGGCIAFPVPYALPPPKYDTSCVPWAWDQVYRDPDVYGETWPRSVRKHGKQEDVE